MLESAVGSHLCISLAMLDNFLYPADVFPSTKLYQQDLAAPPVELTRTAEGRPAVMAGTICGNPSTPDPGRLAAGTVETATIE